MARWLDFLRHRLAFKSSRKTWPQDGVAKQSELEENPSMQEVFKLEQSLAPYDENLLERARTQWQFGDWQSLAQLNRDTLQHHPDRAKLALLSAAGRLQTGQEADARQYIRLAQDWGVSKKLMSQILIAGVHNSIGRAAAMIDNEQGALKHFQNSIIAGAPGSDVKLLSQAWMRDLIKQSRFLNNNKEITRIDTGHKRPLIDLAFSNPLTEHKSIKWVHEYWRTSQQDPMGYANADAKRSLRLVELINEYVKPGRILEIGTNAGRNLFHLHKAGYNELVGIEISPLAVASLRNVYPELSEIPIHIGAVEDIIESFPDKSFKCVFTMAVLEHIHDDSEWIFAHIARIAHCVITIEDELRSGERHFPRNYERVFSGYGFRQIHMEDRKKWGLPSGFTARVFV